MLNPAKDLLQERKYQVFVNGYEIDVAKGVTPGLATTEVVEPVYGNDNSLTATFVNNGTMSMDLIEKKTNNVLLDNLCGISPASTAKAYTFTNFSQVAIWLNRKALDNSKYVGAEFYGKCALAPSGKAGAPNEWGTRTFSGNCDIPRKFEIDGVGLASEKVAISSGAGTLAGAAKLYQNPDDDLYAVYVVAQQWDNSGLVVTDSEILTVTAAMVSSGGAITIAAGDLVNMTLTNVNAAFVVYLASGAGIYPSGAIKTEGYFKAI
jgi:hypothetical protein